LAGEIIAGEVYQVLGREVLLIDAEGNEISIPRVTSKFKKIATAKAKMFVPWYIRLTW
jgi:hypothetical protein